MNVKQYFVEQRLMAKLQHPVGTLIYIFYLIKFGYASQSKYPIDVCL